VEGCGVGERGGGGAQWEVWREEGGTEVVPGRLWGWGLKLREGRKVLLWYTFEPDWWGACD
jgi:hypothetical protein